MLHHAGDAGDAPISTGTVYKKSQGSYWVSVEGRTVVCALSNRLRKELVYPTAAPSSRRARVVDVAEIRMVDPVAIGDQVRAIEAGDGSGMIAEVLPRRNKLARRAAGPKPIEQVIAANVDQVIAIVAAAQPAPSWERLDRYLVSAESLGLPTLICLTKLDLVDGDDLAVPIAEYRGAGYAVLPTSVVDGRGIDRLREVLAERVSVLIGASGAGKTTLLNTLQPGLGQRVGAVSQQTGKGKHTTTHLELFPLEWGGGLIDTPGMREFGLWEVERADLAELFPELRPYLGRCRFGAGCAHRQEPGCAIREAVASGQVSERRYRSYLSLCRKA